MQQFGNFNADSTLFNQFFMVKMQIENIGFNDK
jgi:hypothetical protein